MYVESNKICMVVYLCCVNVCIPSQKYVYLILNQNVERITCK